MMHYLTLGHIDPDAASQGQVVVIRPLDMTIVMRLLREEGHVDEQGQAKLGGQRVLIQDGYVVCPWMTPITNRETERFARRLYQETNCVMADIRSHQLISLESFDDE